MSALITTRAEVAGRRMINKKMDLDAFFAQRANLSADDIARLGELLSTHPYIINRFHALRIFAEAQEWNKPTSDFTAKTPHQGKTQAPAGEAESAAEPEPRPLENQSQSRVDR